MTLTDIVTEILLQGCENILRYLLIYMYTLIILSTEHLQSEETAEVLLMLLMYEF